MSARLTSLNATMAKYRSAVDEIGTGTASSTVSSTPATTPSQVGTVTPTAGSTQVSLSWSAPSNGGNAITDYLIEYKLNASGSWSTFTDSVSSATNVTVTGLTNGSLYNFRVSAINGVGTGTASTPVNETPNYISGPFFALQTGNSLRNQAGVTLMIQQ